MEIKPFEAIGPLAFGAMRSEVRERLGGGLSSFRKTAGAEPTDSYDLLGLNQANSFASAVGNFGKA